MSHVCVGGTMDAKRVNVGSKKNFSASVLQPIPIMPESDVRAIRSPLRDHYVMEILSYSDGTRLEFFRLETLSLPDAVAKVFDAYVGDEHDGP